LFERCALSAPGVVSLAERQAAGEACAFAPEAPLDEARARPSTVDAWLALGALLCAALALLLRA
jgi:hypothetical protein